MRASNRNDMLDLLLEAGFDQSEINPGNGKVTPGCSKCKPKYEGGTVRHETSDCPNGVAAGAHLRSN